MTQKKNIVYIATSIDGRIADRNDGLDWLNSIPNPEGDDMGFVDFMNSIDALLMGRNTYEMVLSFGGEWPYSKPVYVLSSSLQTIPDHLSSRVFPVTGGLTDIIGQLHNQGTQRLYIDGGKTIQSLLKEDLIDELIITCIPILLGGGPKLFDELPKELEFELVDSKVLLNQLVQNHYKRKEAVSKV